MKNISKRFGKVFLSLISRISPTVNAKLLFILRTRKIPNIKNPETFNEKTTYLKLNNYNKNKLTSTCADKYAVREYVEAKGCGKILNKLYGVYNDFDQIDFEKLPQQFAIKCTHGCAYNVIVKNKAELDINEAKRKIKYWQKEKYGFATSELHYTKIKPRIIVEKYLCDKNGKMPLDYKFYCMNGKVECILVCSERDEKLKLSYYDKKWRRLSYEKESWSSQKDIEKPKNLNQMIEYAERLSGNFPFVRVDLYNDNGKIIFGELTFTPACSCAPYYSDYGNMELGKKLCYIPDNQVCLIGHFGGDKEFVDGQTVKTKEIYNFLIKNNFSVSTKDTYLLRRNLFKIFSEVKDAVKNNKSVILIVSSRGYKMAAPCISRYNKRYGRKTFDFVIGGSRYKIFDKSPAIKKVANSFTKIYVETNRIANEYKKRGLNNVEVIPNFKCMNIFPRKTEYIRTNELHSCIFSRILEEKGITDAIKSIRIANCEDHEIKYFLDIYGQIDDSYKNVFSKMLEKNEHVRYMGIVSPDKGSEIINKYDVLLFPTYWRGEGFPGTIIDGLFASVAIIATKWNDNFEILEKDKNAIEVSIKSPSEITAAMKELANDKNKFIDMSSDNSKLAKDFTPDKAMRRFVQELKRRNK